MRKLKEDEQRVSCVVTKAQLERLAPLYAQHGIGNLNILSILLDGLIDRVLATAVADGTRAFKEKGGMTSEQLTAQRVKLMGEARDRRNAALTKLKELPVEQLQSLVES